MDDCLWGHDDEVADVAVLGRGGLAGGGASIISSLFPESVFIELAASNWLFLLVEGTPRSMLAIPGVTTGEAARAKEFALIILGFSADAGRT